MNFGQTTPCQYIKALLFMSDCDVIISRKWRNQLQMGKLFKIQFQTAKNGLNFEIAKIVFKLKLKY